MMSVYKTLKVGFRFSLNRSYLIRPYNLYLDCCNMPLKYKLHDNLLIPNFPPRNISFVTELW